MPGLTGTRYASACRIAARALLPNTCRISSNVSIVLMLLAPALPAAQDLAWLSSSRWCRLMGVGWEWKAIQGRELVLLLLCRWLLRVLILPQPSRGGGLPNIQNHDTITSG